MKANTTMFDKLVEINHKLIRLGGIDRNSFFGRLDILDYLCEETHTEIGERWRKFGRYGNIIIPSAYTKALNMAVTVAHITKEELMEISAWMKGQNTIDQVVGYVMIDFFLKDEYDTIKQ